MTKSEMMLEMQLEVEEHLGEIERIYRRWGLTFDRLTLIARSTTNDDMIILLTTEDLFGLREACRLAVAQQDANNTTEAQS